MKTLARFFALSLPLVGFTFPTSSLLNAQTVTPASASVNAGSINVCPAGKTTPAPCNSTNTLSFSVTAGTTIGSIAILTTGIADLDFKATADDTSTTLCKAQSYSSVTTCTVDVTFAPIAPGTRNGAVEILDGSGNVLAMTYIYGRGIAPQIAFDPAVQVSTAYVHPSIGPGGPGLAVDATGNIFSGNTRVTKILSAGGYTTVVTLPAGVSTTTGALAVDGAGNLFVANEGAVKEFMAVGGYSTATTLGSGFGVDIFGLAVDSTGNVFVADYFNNAVKEIIAAGGYTTVKTLGSGFNTPSGVAVDSAGNVFVADSGNFAVKEILAAGGYTTVKTLGSSFGLPAGVALDAAGNVYVADDDYSAIDQITVADGYATIRYLADVLNGPSDIAVDGNGNVFFSQFSVASPTLSNIGELPRSQPPIFAFVPALVGSTSSDSPLSVRAQNIGNATLTGSGTLSDTIDFSQVFGTTSYTDCTATTALTAGAECNLSIDFAPESAGPRTGEIILTNNSLNGDPTTRSIALSGAGATNALAKVSTAYLQFPSVPYGGASTQTLTVTNVGAGTLTVNPSSNGRGTVITGSTCGAGVAAGKSCTLQVELTPVRLGLNTNTITLQTNGLVNPTVRVLGTATGVGSVNTVLQFGTLLGRGNTALLLLRVFNYGVPGLVSVATSTGATTFKVLSNDCTSGITDSQGCIIRVEYAPVQAGSQTGYLKLIPSTGSEQTIVMEGTSVP